MSTVYFHAFGMTRAKTFGLNPWHVYTVISWCVERDQLHVLVLFHFCLEMHLQNGSVFCICSKACSLSLLRGFGMASGVSVMLVLSDVTVSALGVRSSVILHCEVLFLVWNVGPSWLVAVSIWTVACLSYRSSTSLKRQPAALVWAPDIHSKVMFYVVSSNLHLFSFLLVFFLLQNLVSDLWSLHTVTSAPWR